MKKIITIKGTHCQSCKALIEDVCKDIKGISSCNVNFKSGKTEIEYEGKVEFDLIKKEIESLGSYKVEI